MPPANETKYDKRRTIVTMHNMGRKTAEIHRDTGYPETTIHNTVANYKERGNTNDLPHTGCPPTLNTWDTKRVEKAVEEEPASSLNTIGELAHLTYSNTTISKALKKAKLTLHVKRPKPWTKKGHPKQRMEWCNWRRHWEKEEWRKRVWTDESKIEYDLNPAGQKVRYKPGQELNEKNLKPTFKSGRTNIQVCCAFQYGSKCDLIHIRKRDPAEQTKPKDKLGMNLAQYTHEILEPHLVPYWLSLDDPEGSYLIEDNHSVHKSVTARQRRDAYGIKKDPWPAGSPDFNAIENAWKMVKAVLKMRWPNKDKRPHNAAELFIAAKE